MRFAIICAWPALLFVCSVRSEHSYRFPSAFKFGSATSAHQIEGAWNTDGKGENIWDHLTHVAPDTILNQHNADVAADSYHNYKDDVQLLKNLGVDFYRFSISWSRVLPNGNSSLINEAGLKYYDNLINELLANDIKPVITIYHWDLPQPIQESGGLNSPDFIEYFVEYAEVLFDRFHDRVDSWITFNEPLSFCDIVFIDPNPPYISISYMLDNYLCTHHVLLANAKAYDLYKQKYAKPGDKVGISLNGWFGFPKDANSASDVAAADRYMEFGIGIFAHAIFSRNGDYPKIIREIVDANSKLEGLTASRLPVMTNEERLLIKGKADFFGVNYYTSRYVTSEEHCQDCKRSDAAFKTSVDESWPRDNSTFIYSVPLGLRNLLNWIRTEYDNPEVIITENGWSDYGELNDVDRITYFQTHLNATLNAIHDGCNVTAYTSWTLIDNFEWLFGYSVRFGIYHVDFNVPERTRTPKASVGFLQTVSRTRSIPMDYLNELV